MAKTAARRRWMRVGASGRLDGRMLLGAALVMISVVGGLLFWGSAQDTTPVLVAARDIAPGHIIQRDDLAVTWVRLEGKTSSLAIPDAQINSVTGHAASRTVYAGEIVV